MSYVGFRTPDLHCGLASFGHPLTNKRIQKLQYMHAGIAIVVEIAVDRIRSYWGQMGMD
jgi:hypothetical protein